MSNFNTNYTVIAIVDGDGLIIQNKFSAELIEIRLLGIDAPEIKWCKKLKKDEQITRLAGAFLIKLGLLSKRFLQKVLKVGSKVSIKQEKNNTIDKYGRTLAYVILPSGKSLNELMIREGYAKPLIDFECSELANYQKFNTFARQGRKGLYTLARRF